MAVEGEDLLGSPREASADRSGHLDGPAVIGDQVKPKPSAGAPGAQVDSTASDYSRQPVTTPNRPTRTR
jgi:hypothetical protein